MASFHPITAPQNPAIYSNFYTRETYTHQNYGQFWIDLTDTKSLTRPLWLPELRTNVMEQLSRIPALLPKRIERKYVLYAHKKGTLPFSTPLEKTLNDRAMDNMAHIFARFYIYPLSNGIQKIQEALPNVQAHWQQFQSLCSNPEPAPHNTLRTLAKEMRSEREKLHQQLNQLNAESIKLDRTIREINRQGLRIGYAFLANPCPYLQGTPMPVLQPNILTAPTISKAVEIMENMKQQRSVAEGTQHFYRLLIRSMRALRNMEQGMANCLEQTIPRQTAE